MAELSTKKLDFIKRVNDNPNSSDSAKAIAQKYLDSAGMTYEQVIKTPYNPTPKAPEVRIDDPISTAPRPKAPEIRIDDPGGVTPISRPPIQTMGNNQLPGSIPSSTNNNGIATTMSTPNTSTQRSSSYTDLLNAAYAKKDVKAVQDIISATDGLKQGTPAYEANQDARNWMAAVGVYLNQNNTTQQNQTQQNQAQAPSNTTQPQKKLGLRDVLETLGYKVDWKDNTVYANGMPVDVSGLVNENGHFVGDEKTIKNIVNQIGAGYNPQSQQFQNNDYAKLRDVFKGHNVQWDAKTGAVTIDGVPIDTSKLPLIDGSYYVNQDNANQIADKLNNTSAGGGQNGTTFEQALNSMGFGDALKEMMSQNKEMKGMVQEFSKQMMTAYTQLQTQMTENAKIINQAFGNGFNYDPNTDKSLQNALKYAKSQVEQSLAARGMLASSQGNFEVSQLVEDMTIKYEQLAYEKYTKNVQLQLQKAEALGNLSQNSFTAVNTFANNILNMNDKVNSNTLNTLKEMVTTANNLQSAYDKKEENRLKAEKQEYEKALDRLNIKGYVANKEDALLLGIAPNTPSQKAREMAQQKIDDIDKALFEASIRSTDRLVEYNKSKGAMKFQSEVDNAGLINGSLILNSIMATKPYTQWNSFIEQNRDKILEKTGNAYPKFIEMVNEAKQKAFENTRNLNRDEYEKQQDAIQNSNEAKRLAISADANARAGERLEFDKQKIEKSPYFDMVNNRVKTLLDTYTKDNTKKPYINKFGSVENKELVTTIMSGLLEPSDENILFNTYHIKRPSVEELKKYGYIK